jgi:NitT/TauT family transport system substrate-binding protein
MMGLSLLPFSACAERSDSSRVTRVTIAVGGRSQLYYLPLTIAEQLGYFRAEGLDVTIVDFAGGSQAVQALVGGSADVVSGAFDHTVSMLAKGQKLRAFVLEGRAPQLVLGVSTKTLPNFQSIADLKGKKIGVTTPGSGTHVLVAFLLARAGLSHTDVSIVSVGNGASAVAAVRSGRVDALSNSDPSITHLVRSGDLTIVSDTRVIDESDKVFGGPMLGACLYSSQRFIDKHSATVQSLTNALVRADQWLHQASNETIVKTVPESYLLGDRVVYEQAVRAARGAWSPDGRIPEHASRIALQALASLNPELAHATLDLTATYTNDFVQNALSKHAAP